MKDYDYLTVDAWPEHDLCLLEWDVAIDPFDMVRFARYAQDASQRIIVAPYRIGHGRWVHQDESNRRTTRVVDRIHSVPDYAPSCDRFGMGCIYLPWAIVREWLSTKPDRWTDGTFSEWYYHTHGRTPIIWTVRVAHLHEP